jgi:hypothetical protein
MGCRKKAALKLIEDPLKMEKSFIIFSSPGGETFPRVDVLALPGLPCVSVRCYTIRQRKEGVNRDVHEPATLMNIFRTAMCYYYDMIRAT